MRKYLSLMAGALSIAFLAVQPVSALDANKPGTNGAVTQDTYKLLDKFGNVFEQVRKHAETNPKDSELIDGALKGMLHAIDPHSDYMTADEYKSMQETTTGEFGGLGMQVEMQGDLVKVVAPIDDTPSSRADIRSGDLIEKIGTDEVSGMTLEQAVKKLKGTPTTSVKLSLIRKGEKLEKTLVREIIHVQSVKAEKIGPEGSEDIEYIKLTQFTENTADGLKKAIDEAKSLPGLKGIVLDLRNDPGGLLNMAAAVVNAFVQKGEIVSTRGRDPQDTERLIAKPGNYLTDAKLIILQNGGSASASEIVAGALQDYHRATVIGTRSFGKGSVQSIVSLGKGEGALRLTTARYYLPSNRTIQNTGVEPDITMEQDEPDDIKGKTGTKGEASLKGHLKVAGSKEETGSQSYVPKERADDKVLNFAFELLRGTKSDPAFPPSGKPVLEAPQK